MKRTRITWWYRLRMDGSFVSKRREDAFKRRTEILSRADTRRARAFHLAARTAVAQPPFHPPRGELSRSARSYVMPPRGESYAGTFHLAVRAIGAVRAGIFQLAVTTRVALHANGFMPPSARAPLIRRRSVSRGVTSSRLPPPAAGPSCSTAPDPCRRGSRSLPR